jgi:hypothetical protein
MGSTAKAYYKAAVERIEDAHLDYTPAEEKFYAEAYQED